MNSPGKILFELQQLAAFYKIEDSPFLSTLTEEYKPAYLEVVLDRDQFAVVLGGLARHSELISLARANQFHNGIIHAFEAVCTQFPDKMVYAKFPLKANGHIGDMYVLLLEPWEKVFGILESMSFSIEAIEDLRTSVAGSALCFFLGFTADKNTGSLIAKPYHLFNRKNSNQIVKPFLVGYRLSRDGMGNYRKFYRAKVSWEELNVDDRWREINSVASRIYSDNYAMLSGMSNEGKQKVYIFRFDCRENERFSNKTYNFYIEEGFRLLQQNKNEEARNSFLNAIDYAPSDENAFMGVSSTYILEGRYNDGIKYALEAKKLNSKVSNSIWFNPVPLDIEATIATRSLEVQQAGTAESYNLRGIAYYKNKDFELAIADFNKAIELDPMNADVRNNLGGALLNVGRFSEVVKTCNIALSLFPAMSNMNLVVARQAIGLEKEISQAPTAKAYNDLGIQYYLLDLYDEAAVNFSKAEKLLLEA